MEGQKAQLDIGKHNVGIVIATLLVKSVNFEKVWKKSENGSTNKKSSKKEIERLAKLFFRPNVKRRVKDF